jgi:4-carboxymuconolactone decarboxylase
MSDSERIDPDAGSARREPTPGPVADARSEQGMRVRRAVLGDAHVDRAQSQLTDFDHDFQDYITRCVWGELWVRPGLPLETRHLLTIAVLAVLNRQDELAMHIRATRNTGVTADQIKEVFLHVAAYAGVPAAHAAIKTAKGALFPDEAPNDG